VIGLCTIVNSHQFVGRADNRRLKAGIAAGLLNPVAQGSIRNVFVIPRQQVFYTVNCRDGDMKCVPVVVPFAGGIKEKSG
jgi:hypothetical protein